MNKARSDWEIQVFYDGQCPICKREIAFLKKRNRQGKILFVDFATADFSESEFGVKLEELMAELHGRLPDGSWVRGVETFQILYAAIGWKWLAALTRWPVISQLTKIGYWIFAKNRVRFFRRGCDTSCKTDQKSS